MAQEFPQPLEDEAQVVADGAHDGVDLVAEAAHAVKVFEDMQTGDVKETYADIETSRRDLGFEPRTTIDEGLPRFVEWYREYHRV